jgi:hypothetical protein
MCICYDAPIKANVTTLEMNGLGPIVGGGRGGGVSEEISHINLRSYSS